jgi:hypothetical protein
MKCIIFLPVDALQGSNVQSRLLRDAHTYPHSAHTPRTLAKFDGERILLAIAGTAFDITAGRGFYGPGERYLTAKMTHGMGISRVGWHYNHLILAGASLFVRAGSLSIADPIAADLWC